MRIHVMKMFHWAHEWPEDYKWALDRTPDKDKLTCHKGHERCSLVTEGPCKEDLKIDQSSTRDD